MRTVLHISIEHFSGAEFSTSNFHQVSCAWNCIALMMGHNQSEWSIWSSPTSAIITKVNYLREARVGKLQSNNKRDWNTEIPYIRKYELLTRISENFHIRDAYSAIRTSLFDVSLANQLTHARIWQEFHKWRYDIICQINGKNKPFVSVDENTGSFFISVLRTSVTVFQCYYHRKFELWTSATSGKAQNIHSSLLSVNYHAETYRMVFSMSFFRNFWHGH